MPASDSYDIIDFHTHHVPPPFALTTLRGREGPQREQWERINRKLASVDDLMAHIDSGDIAGRVVNIPGALMADIDGHLPAGTYREINDRLADLVSRRSGALCGIASVDGFGGDAAADEVRRAVKELGLRGVFVDCARGDWLLDCPRARPVLTAAAALGVPVFAHPIDPQPLSRQMRPYGRLGGFLARGTVNAASLVALVEGGVFDELKSLRVVVTTLAIGGLMLEGGFPAFSARPDVAATLRAHVFIDTMGFHPALVRTAVDLLGADNVMVGSDWPIVNDAPIGDRVRAALAAAGLDEVQRKNVAAGNARRLLNWSE